MAFWIKKRDRILDPSRPGGVGEIVKFGCDTAADISDLPGPDPRIRGSTATILKPVYELWELGTDGWEKVG